MPINITFEALPDYTYPGKILSVDPALVTVDNTPAVQATASIDLSAHPITAPVGHERHGRGRRRRGAQRAAGAGRGAARDRRSGQYAVFVVKSNGELELRPVEVGLKDLVNAEILSGLHGGGDGQPRRRSVGTLIDLDEHRDLGRCRQRRHDDAGGGCRCAGGGQP